MPDTGVTSVTESWQGFIDSLRISLERLAAESLHHPFATVRDAALAIAETDAMLEEIEAGYKNSASGEAADVVIQELNTFSSLVTEYAQTDDETNVGKRTWRFIVGAGKTAIGSVGDIFKMSEKGKAILKLLEEGIDLSEIRVEMAAGE